MARSAKTSTDTPAPTEVPPAYDAFESPVSPPESVLEAETISEPDSEPLADSVLIVEPETVPLQDDPASTQPVETTGPESIRSDPPAPVLASAPAPAPKPVPKPAPVTVRKVGFIPRVLGGVVAAGLGFVAAWQGFGMRPTADTTQTDRIAALEAHIAALPEAEAVPDLAPLTAEIAALRTDMTGQIGPLTDGLAALHTRLTALENAPLADGTLSSTAIAGWQAELDMLRTEIAAQETRMQAMAAEASSRLDAAQSTVAEIEQNATASATALLQRAVVTRIQAALDAGTAFDAALGELTATGVAAPDALTAVAVDGVPTIGVLTTGFPEAARAALATARAEGLADDGGNSMFAFLRSQLDMRSVTPREGTDPDAILSRAEAALKEGRLSDALAEIDALPEVVRAEMSGWMTLAEARIAAVAALQGLSESLPSSSN